MTTFLVDSPYKLHTPLVDTVPSTFGYDFSPHVSYCTVATLSNISQEYAVAFGGFADKRAIPYSLPSQDPMTYQQKESATSTECVLD